MKYINKTSILPVYSWIRTYKQQSWKSHTFQACSQLPCRPLLKLNHYRHQMEKVVPHQMEIFVHHQVETLILQRALPEHALQGQYTWARPSGRAISFVKTKKLTCYFWTRFSQWMKALHVPMVRRMEGAMIKDSVSSKTKKKNQVRPHRRMSSRVDLLRPEL